MLYICFGCFDKTKIIDEMVFLHAITGNFTILFYHTVILNLIVD